MIVGALLIGYSVGSLIYPFVYLLIYPSALPPSDNYDWAGPHIIINWQFIAAIALLIAGVGLIVWSILQKRK